jgi:hypothetical protein
MQSRLEIGVDVVRIVPTGQISVRGGGETQPPADIFLPTQREAAGREPTRREAPGREPDPATAVEAEQVRPGPPRGRPNGLLPLAIAAVLLSGLLGVVTIGAFPERGAAATQDTPPAAPDRPLGGGDTGDGAGGTGGDESGADESGTDESGTDESGTDSGPGTSTGGGGIDVATVPAGTSVSLPGPVSRDWVAPGARSDGFLVRADLDQESIEFRAANTQPGLPGTFDLMWSGARSPADRGEATTMLGVRPGGWVAFVVRPLTSPADLVLHLSGDGVAVDVSSEAGSTREVLSAPTAVVTVPLPAATAATVTVSPAGDQIIGVTTAELR